MAVGPAVFLILVAKSAEPSAAIPARPTFSNGVGSGADSPPVAETSSTMKRPPSPCASMKSRSPSVVMPNF